MNERTAVDLTDEKRLRAQIRQHQIPNPSKQHTNHRLGLTRAIRAVWSRLLRKIQNEI